MDQRKIEEIEENQSLLESGKFSIEGPQKKLANNKNFYYSFYKFALCFTSLQFSYLIWGMMQEMIMDTQFKPTPRNPSGKFPSATFCVFSNRFLAIFISAFLCYYYNGSLSFGIYSKSSNNKFPAPLISFFPSALSNTISSFAQYKALNYVSFSLQTIFKSTKIIPVMIMGKILKDKKYKWIEYIEACLISLGVLIFSDAITNSTFKGQILGILLLSLYVLSDSFTSQWQSKIYSDFGKVDHFQMMFGVNVSAIIITSIALVLSGELVILYEFFQYNPNALYYNIVTAITSTTGQLSIFYTIKEFGPIVFTIIMTTRQMLSIVISNYLFNHPMKLNHYVGAILVFSTIIYSTYRKYHEGPTSK